MKAIQRTSDIAVFESKLQKYKKLIDKDIAVYSKQLQQTTLKNYGPHARLEVDTFVDILQRDARRLRGALLIVAYEMCGGKDQTMIVEAARAIEIIQAYILIIDDIQDRSDTRRGGPTAHVMLADHHRKAKLSGDASHFGLAITLNAALGGMHAANTILANLNATEEQRLKVLSTSNRSMQLTAHGQTNDLMYEMLDQADEQAVERVFELKTANYTVLNPLKVGMILAGADETVVNAITDYAMATGKAFQITNDLLGTFGHKTKHASMDDIREGKRTLLVVHALEHATAADKAFLHAMLGNEAITPVEFKRCQDILVASGAVAYTKNQAVKHAKAAHNALEKAQTGWSAEGTQFLRGFAHYLLERQP